MGAVHDILIKHSKTKTNTQEQQQQQKPRGYQESHPMRRPEEPEKYLKHVHVYRVMSETNIFSNFQSY